eukprot:4278934-Amphidinium_carterae.1
MTKEDSMRRHKFEESSCQRAGWRARIQSDKKLVAYGSEQPSLKIWRHNQGVLRDEETVIPVVDDDAEEEEIVMEEDMGAVPAEGFGFKAFDPESERRPDPLAVEVVDTKTTIVDTAVRLCREFSSRRHMREASQCHQPVDSTFHSSVCSFSMRVEFDCIATSEFAKARWLQKA